MSLDTDILIIGAGMSGLGLACQLVLNHGLRSFEIIEKSTDVGGTWLQNTYPGCGCDVPSHFYSYSFEPNPDWSQKFASQPEIQEYFRNVANKYNIPPHVRFGHAVDSAVWNAKEAYWQVTIRDVATGKTTLRTAKILFSAVGALSVPKDIDLPGKETFAGPLFHSAQWDHSFDWANKDVVVLGNGCSATQFLPVISAPPRAARRVTQFARSTHYLAPRPNETYSPLFKAALRYVPLVQRVYRFLIYASMERDFPGLVADAGGARARAALKAENERYVHETAPARYRDFLVPDYMIGCKRKVMDTGYLAALHQANVELIPDDPVAGVTPDGVRTRSGRAVRADAIVLAVGFATHRLLHPMEIRGEGGLSLTEHWARAHAGAPQAYLGTCVPGFPNFFTLMGPNTVTGHLSVIFTVECQIAFSLRVLAPVLRELRAGRGAPDSVVVRHDAAAADSAWLQARAARMVWSAGGCTNWFVDPASGLNTMMYPDWQFKFWLRSVAVERGAFAYRSSATGGEVRAPGVLSGAGGLAGAAAGLAGLAGACWWARRWVLA